VPLDGFAIDDERVALELGRDPPRPKERMGGEDLVDAMFVRDFLGRLLGRPIVPARSAQPEPIRLDAER